MLLIVNLLVISVTQQKPQNKVSNTIMHVTLSVVNKKCSPITVGHNNILEFTPILIRRIRVGRIDFQPTLNF